MPPKRVPDQATGEHEAEIRMPEKVAEARLAATGSAVPGGGPRPKLPPDFQKGVAISMFQNSGGINSNWGRFAEARGKFFGLMPNIMDKSSPNDGACDFWDKCVPWLICCPRCNDFSNGLSQTPELRCAGAALAQDCLALSRMRFVCTSSMLHKRSMSACCAVTEPRPECAYTKQCVSTWTAVDVRSF